MTNAEKIIAKCGLICSECNACQATIQDSDELRKKTAEQWSAMFNATIDWKTINCLGCQQSDKEKLFSYCSMCEIRNCALEKGFTTCADCPDFGCNKVKEIWKHNSVARTNLEDLRA